MGGVLGLLDALPDGSPDVGDIHSGGALRAGDPNRLVLRGSKAMDLTTIAFGRATHGSDRWPLRFAQLGCGLSRF